MNDPLGAARLREAALTAWRASPARLREDANAEEDHSRGGYRDRVVVELAQNAADAAGGGGRLLLRLITGPVPLLIAANTGSPLDAAGLASLASLRASAKAGDDRSARGDASTGRHSTVGRFGVGFAAVRSVADEIAVLTADGSAHFSLARTAELLTAEPALAAVIDRRRGALPALRLPFAGPGPVGEAAGLDPGGLWATVVVLALRDDDAVAQVAAQLAAVDDALLLALPGLERVVVESDGSSRELSDVLGRWVVASATGELATADLADRPTEEQDRRGWQLTWAVRREGRTEPGAVHAPTPTDETCSVPALLVGTFPLDPSRRHIAASTATDLLVRRAGEVWVQLLLDCRQERAAGRPAPDPLDLLPRGWPGGGIDGSLRESVLAATRAAPVLTAAGDGRGVAPEDAEVLEAPWTCDRAALDVLGSWDTALVRLTDPQRDLVRILGLRSVAMSELVEMVPAGEPAWLRRVYDLFASSTGDALAELSAVPVPLRDGRVVRGARGLVVVDDDLGPGVLDALSDAGLRIVDPQAAHPVLERLGAERLDAEALARHPMLRSWVLGELAQEDHEDEDDEAAAELLLALLAHASEHGRELDHPEPWWGEALLEAGDGGLVPARGLALPGSDAAAWFDPEVLPRVAAQLVDRWGGTLAAVGVRLGLTAVRVDDPVVAEALDGWPEYLDEAGLPQEPDGDGAELTAVADLDAVLPEAWPAVLAALADGSWTAELQPVRRPDGGLAPSYTGWWLRHRGEIGLDRPFFLPGVMGSGALSLLAPPPGVLVGLLARTGEAGVGSLLRAVGGVTSAADLDASGWVVVLGDLDHDAPVDLAVAVDLWRALVALSHRGPLDEIAQLPALVALGPVPQVRVVDVEEVAVVDRMWAQLATCLPALVVPSDDAERVAVALDIDTAGDRAHGRLMSTGHRAPTPEVLVDLLPGVPRTWVEHDDLLVDGEQVDWWIVDGEVHAATTDGVADAFAALAGGRHRDRVARLLTDPLSRGAVLLDRAGDPAEG